MRIVFAHALIILLWGSAFAGIRHGLEGYSPEHLSLLRLLIGSIALIIYAAYTKMSLPQLRDIPVIFIFGFLGFAVYQTALSIGEQTVNAGTASLLVSTSPLFIGFIGKFFLQERTGVWYWLGAVISFVGIALISFGSEDSFSIEIGLIFILIASFSESLYFVFQKKYLNKYGVLPFTTYTIWAATIIMLLYARGLVGQILEAPVEATISAVYLGLFPTVIAYIALAYITAHSGVSDAAGSLYLTPAAAFIIAWIWLGEVPAAVTVIGGLFTLIGVSLTYLKDKAPATHKRNTSNGIS
jgi:drug/metabolite transporter (DMT)-like permease